MGTHNGANNAQWNANNVRIFYSGFVWSSHTICDKAAVTCHFRLPNFRLLFYKAYVSLSKCSTCCDVAALLRNIHKYTAVLDIDRVNITY